MCSSWASCLNLYSVPQFWFGFCQCLWILFLTISNLILIFFKVIKWIRNQNWQIPYRSTEWLKYSVILSVSEISLTRLDLCLVWDSSASRAERISVRHSCRIANRLRLLERSSFAETMWAWKKFKTGWKSKIHNRKKYFFDLNLSVPV